MSTHTHCVAGHLNLVVAVLLYFTCLFLYLGGKKLVSFLPLLKMMAVVLCYNVTLQYCRQLRPEVDKVVKKTIAHVKTNWRERKRKSKRTKYRNVGRVRALLDLWKVAWCLPSFDCTTPRLTVCHPCITRKAACMRQAEARTD